MLWMCFWWSGVIMCKYCISVQTRVHTCSCIKPWGNWMCSLLYIFGLFRSTYSWCICHHVVSEWVGSRTLRPQDISAPGHFVTNFKPNAESPVELCLVGTVLGPNFQSVPTFRRSDAEVSRTTFFGAEVTWDGAEVSHAGPKCLGAEVSGNQWVERQLQFIVCGCPMWQRLTAVVVVLVSKYVKVSSLVQSIRRQVAAAWRRRCRLSVECLCTDWNLYVTFFPIKLHRGVTELRRA